MERQIVVPGEMITDERKKLGENVFASEGKIYSKVLGLANTASDYANVIALNGVYKPKRGDLIVGIVKSEEFSGYRIDVNSFYLSFLSKKVFIKSLSKHDVISAKIESVDETNEIKLDDVRVFYGGEVIEISPVKIPRVIGKQGSMLNVLKKYTGTSFMVGRNGRIWMKGGNTILAKQAIKKIEREAHLPNLTNKMDEFLLKNSDGIIEDIEEQEVSE